MTASGPTGSSHRAPCRCGRRTTCGSAGPPAAGIRRRWRFCWPAAPTPAAVDDDGQTALHLTALAGDLTGCRSLLAAGADPRALNYAGQTPLDCAQGVEEPTARGCSGGVAARRRAEPRHRSLRRSGVSPRYSNAPPTPSSQVTWMGLRALLREHPELATARSSRPHRCTLLHYLAANGVEGERQKTPANAVEVIELLIGAGSDPNASCTYRGGPGETTAGLLAGSAPPRNAGLTAAHARGAGAWRRAVERSVHAAGAPVRGAAGRRCRKRPGGRRRVARTGRPRAGGEPSRWATRRSCALSWTRG